MRSGVAVIAVLVALTLTACTTAVPDPTAPRVVTTEEAQLLAVVRFKNFDAGTRTISSSFSDAGTDLKLDGWFDYANDTGYAALEADGTPNSLLLWNGTTIAAHEPTGSTELPPPDVDVSIGDTWRVAAIAPQQSTLHALAAIIEGLGADRPDNPLLLQQGGALWLRDDTVDGTAVTVFAGPTGTDATTSPPKSTAVDPDASNVHYWITSEGLLLRLEVRLGTQWVTVDFGDGGGVTIANPYSGVSP